MGSGLILLLIVGAWLAVLVPMALRSHEAASAHSTVDRFHDAMRVLSRRSSAAPGAPPPSDVVPEVPVTAAAAARAPRAAAARPGPTPAARRRRAVGVLVMLSAGSLVGALLGPLWLFALHAAADGLLLVGFLWLRSQAVLREEREWRTAMGDRRSDRGGQSWSPLQELAPVPAPAAVYGIPDRMPARREIVSSDSVFDQDADLPAKPRPAVVAAPAPQVPAARGAKGEPWSPVPVPVPTYITAPRAPRRRIDLTEPAPGLASAERSLGIDDRGPELEHILGRRAVGG